MTDALVGIRRLLLVAGLAVLVVLLYLQPLAQMTQLWSLSSYKHAWLIAPVSLYFLWRARRRLSAAPVQGSIWGIALAVALVVAYAIGAATSVQAVEHFAIVLMIPTLVLAVIGVPAFRTVAFPCLILLGAVPAGEEIIPLLLEVTADICEWLLRAVGVPVLREGLFFYLPGGSFEIAKVCSGLRYLLAGALTALLFAYLNFARWPKRILFVLVAAFGFVMANALRAFITMLVASSTRGRWFGGADHIYFGMVLFAVVMLVLMWYGLKHADAKPEAPLAAPIDPPPVAVGRALLVGIATFAVLALGPITQAARHSRVESAAVTLNVAPVGGCGPSGPWSAPWRPALTGFDAEEAVTFDCAGQDLHVYAAIYSSQTQGHEMVGAGNQLVPGAEREYTERRRRALATATGASIDINEVTVRRGDDDMRIVWYWYAVNGAPARTGTEVKLREAIHAFDPNPPTSMVLLLAADGKTGGEERLREMLDSAAPAVWAGATQRMTGTAR